ncbi:MAG: hypothetical protein WBX25_22670 [Rhodomicrobium sp.]
MADADEDDITPEDLRIFEHELHLLSGKPYAGILIEPLKPEDFGKPENPYQPRVDELFRHFEIDPNKETAWQDLALNLARSHVPGFQLHPVQGKSKTQGLDDFNLLVWLHVFLVFPTRKKSESAVLRKLIALGVTTDTFDTLRKRVARARKYYDNMRPAIFRTANHLIDQAKASREARAAILDRLERPSDSELIAMRRIKRGSRWAREFWDRLG